MRHFRILSTVLLLGHLTASAASRDYGFDGRIPRDVPDNYLSRAVTFSEFLHGQGNVTDNLRFLTNTGAKFVGRAIYGRSQGGLTPSGWTCDHLPYLVKLDNYGVSKRPGEPGTPYFTWGYDEISWFAHQPEDYRDEWLRYAWRWLRENDPNGWLQMPGSRVLHAPVNGQHWYWANTRSTAMPDGFNQEETIKAIWAGRAKSN
jgi:hypothetical protein